MHLHKTFGRFVCSSVKPLLGIFAICLTVAAAAAEKPLSIPDVALTDQNGRSVRLDRDVVHGKIVVMNFIFTTCTTVCSPMGANFAALQQRLGDRNDVALVSISLDPSTDTPAKLKAWSERFHARPDWTLLTGRESDVTLVLKALGVYTPNRFTHAPIALVGSDASGRWERVSGLLPPDQLVSVIDSVRPHPPTREHSTK